MIDRHQEADLLKSLAEAYQEICEIKVIRDGGAEQKAPKEIRPVKMGGAGFHGKVGGLGKDKAEVNNPSADDKRIEKYNKAKGVNVKPKRGAEKRVDKPTPKSRTPKEEKAYRNREATKIMRRQGWTGRDDDTPEKPHKSNK